MPGLLLVATGCGAENDTTGSAKRESPSSMASTTEGGGLAHAADGRYEVGAGYALAVHCVGTGTPVVILEPGTDGSGLEENSLLIDPLAARAGTTVCTYDRAGFGQSEPPVQRRRTIDDASTDLHDLVAAADLEPPYVLVGPSGGGLLAVNYAGLYPRQVAGLVLLDVPAPITNLDEDFPGPLAWKNPEHLDYVHAERTLALHPPSLGDIPVSVVTSEDEGSVEDQSVWLKLSTGSRQTTLPGGHDLTSDNQAGVIAEVVAMLDLVRE